MDPDDPRDPHASHDLVLYDRWAECTVCGVRDHWEAIEATCKGRPVKDGTVELDTACVEMLREIAAFRAWWVAKDLPLTKPTYQEWAAEWACWTAHRGGKR